MKNQVTTVRSLFGLTQNEMAMLLNVSRQQLSLYELGLRRLPLHATQLIAALLSHRETSMAKGNTAKKPAKDKKLTEHLNALLRENEYQQQKIARRIATLERKQAAADNKALIADFINQHKADTRKPGNVRFHVLANNIAKSNNDALETELMKLKVKLEVLGVERVFLEGRVR